MSVTGLDDPLAGIDFLREGLLIGGEWVAGERGTTEVLDPASGARLAAVANAGDADVERAIAAAAAAGREWAREPATVRAEVLREWHREVLDHAEEVATVLTAEGGKPLAEARGEVAYGAGYIRWFAEAALRPDGESIPADAAGRRMFALREPIGVCAAITPWNFPLAMVTRKLAPALAAGCATVLKPASETPLTALAMAELGTRAGLPAGLLNVVHGPGPEVGRMLCESETVRKLTFTGSTAVGRLLMAQSAPTVKKLSLELGGNAPLLVFADADLDAAVAGTLAAKFRNGGQTCVCPNRLLVADAVHDEFVERLAAAVAELRVGPGLEPGTEVGPLIDGRAVEKVERLLADAGERGARTVVGGARHPLGRNFFAPTVVADVAADCDLASEEIFGPVAAVGRFGSEEEALALANATESGLAAYLFSSDSGRIWRCVRELEFGMVGVNTGRISYEGAPFGGVKQAGLGREGGPEGLAEFQEVKYVCLDGIDAA